MDKPVSTPKDFRVGVVLFQSVRIFVNNFLRVFLTLLVALSIILAVDIVLAPYITFDLNDEPSRVQVFLAVLGLAGYFTVYVTGVSIAIHAVFQHLREGRTRIGDVLSRGLARAPLMILLGILVSIAMLTVTVVFGGSLGVITFNIWPMADITLDGVLIDPREQLRFAALGTVGSLPALHLVVMWYVSSAALAAEDLGPVRALERSRKLTQKFRWRILALAVISGCIALLPEVAGIVVTQLIGIKTWPVILLWLAFSALSHAYMWVIPCAAFVELRRAKEGKDVQKISDVFD